MSEVGTMPRHEINCERDDIESIHCMAMEYAEFFTNFLFARANNQTLVRFSWKGGG